MARLVFNEFADIILLMFQRLEHPECCPKEYYNLMLKCWQHDPDQRPRFKDLMKMLPEVKQKQNKAIQVFHDHNFRAYFLFSVNQSKFKLFAIQPMIAQKNGINWHLEWVMW